MKSLVLPLLCLALFLPFAAAQDQPIKPDSEEWRAVFDPPYLKPTELPTDSPLRKELFDQLRPQVKRIAKQPALFEGSLRVFKNWAMFGGRSLDAKGTSLKLPSLDNDDTVALWLRTFDGWKLVDFGAGHSDAFFIVWPEKFGAPKELVLDHP